MLQYCRAPSAIARDLTHLIAAGHVWGYDCGNECCILHHKAWCLLQVLQSKKKLLDKLHADVAAKEDRPLKVMLSEDENVAKRRETCMTRLELMKKAQTEVNTVAY